MQVEVMDGYGYTYRITSMNPDTVAAWWVETITTIKPTAQAPARVIVYPSFRFGADTGPMGEPDWLTDSRVLCGEPGKILRPLDLVEYLRGQIERAEELAARESERM